MEPNSTSTMSLPSSSNYNLKLHEKDKKLKSKKGRRSCSHEVISNLEEGISPSSWLLFCFKLSLVCFNLAITNIKSLFYAYLYKSLKKFN